MASKMRSLRLLVAYLVTSALAMIDETLLEHEPLPEQECPVDCHCHYFRINWVTDCSNSNLTAIPYAELSHNVYILDMNDNNIANVEPFPSAIKLRRLQMAYNLLTELTYKSFAGLTYLLDADFSCNSITHVDPEAFR